MAKKTLLAPAFIAILGVQTALAQYPEMRSLTRDDPLYMQLQYDIEQSYRASRSRQILALPPISIFTYRRKPAEDLFSLNARLNLPYDAIATLNAMENATSINNLDRVLICSRPGIFIHDPPRTEFEQMMLGTRLNDGLVPEKLMVWRYGFKEAYSYFPGSGFNDVERAYFLHILFRFPISQGSITSRYGPRANPFSGHPEFHNGIDIGAPIGTEVCAAREGKVTEAGTNPTLGSYVILTHPGGFKTVYGHLSAISVTLGAEVRTGEVIGKVGKTGLATGPHLHFEVRCKGGSTDPSPYMMVKK
jgi:murein DD-endopeptidase MepM/ murein hydrolase activator NlpD